MHRRRNRAIKTNRARSTSPMPQGRATRVGRARPVYEPPPLRCPPGRIRPRHGGARDVGNHRRSRPRSGLRIGGRRRTRRIRRQLRDVSLNWPCLKGEGDDQPSPAAKLQSCVLLPRRKPACPPGGCTRRVENGGRPPRDAHALAHGLPSALNLLPRCCRKDRALRIVTS